MTASTVNGSGNGARSGAHVLNLLAAPLNVAILHAVAEGSKQQAELRREAGSPAQTTLRAQLKQLTGIGAVARHRRDNFPGALEYELAAPGRDLLAVSDVLQQWLQQAPDGPLEIGTNPAKAAIKALAEGWSTTILRALAPGPLSLTELDGVVNSLSYPALERRFTALRLASQIEVRPGNGRGTPYGVSPWLRRGIAPLIAAARWERRHLPAETTPLNRIDAEALFLLSVPLLELPDELTGTCRMAVEIANGRAPRPAGVTVGVENGRVVSCATRLQTESTAWIHGRPLPWLDALIERDRPQLELGGDCAFAQSLLDGLNSALFGIGARK